ncbi:hypothetical protein D3C80_1674590 [compost metagenome]
MTLVLRAQRHSLLDALGQQRTVAQEEEQQVKHHAETDDELEGVLPDAEGLGGEELAALHRSGRYTILQLGEIAQPYPLQPRVCP